MKREEAKELPIKGMYSDNGYGGRVISDSTYWYLVDTIYDDIKPTVEERMKKLGDTIGAGISLVYNDGDQWYSSIHSSAHAECFVSKDRSSPESALEDAEEFYKELCKTIRRT